VIELAIGPQHSCAVLSGGTLRCWGFGVYGQLGYPNHIVVGDDETPASLGDIDIGGKVEHVAAGYAHTCALLDGGRLRCFGWAASGPLGYGNVDNIGDDEVPAAAGDVNVGGKVIQVAAGDFHTCALLEGGRVRCWGNARFGQLGYANTQGIGAFNTTPADAGDVNVGGLVVQIAAGGNSTCARIETGAVRCWGDNAKGQLGYGNTDVIGDDETPAWAGSVSVGGTVVDLTVGKENVCVLLDTGNARCWGSGVLGYKNTNTIGDDEKPSTAGDVYVGGKVLRLSSGWNHTCAVLEGGVVRCWGGNETGQLGYGNVATIGDDEAPAAAGNVKVPDHAIRVGAGGGFTCALVVGGRVRCWGSNMNGRLGLGYVLPGPIGDDESPASVDDVPVF
jgi:alpha-tubulin suppressor-like RCC1 family protein